MADYTPPIDTKLADVSEDEKVLLKKLSGLRTEAEEYKKRSLKRPDSSSEDDDLKLYRGEVGPKDRFFDCNFVQAFIDRSVAQLTDNRPTLRVEHRKVGLKNVAQVLEKAIHAVWQESDLQRQAYKMCHNAAVKRSSGIYTGYDATLDDIYFEVLRQDQVLCDPIVNEAGLLDRGEYVLIKRTKPLSELRMRFPGRGAQVKSDSSLLHVSQGARVVDSPVTDLVKSGGTKTIADAVPRAEVWEGFIKDRQQDLTGKFLFPTYRHIIHTKELILSDMPLAYWDGRIPIDWFDWAVDPDHPWGISAPSLMRRLQLSFNQVMDGTVENTLISNFIQIIGDYDAIDPQRWKDLQKIRSSLILRKTGQNKAINVLPPPVYGADKVMLAKTLFNFAQLLMGVTDVTLGESPGSLQSGLAIEGLQESANLMTRARASRLEDFFSRIGNKAIARILQFMTSDRVFSFLGPTGEAFEYAVKRREMFITDDGQPLSESDRRDVFKYLRFSVLPGSSAPGTRVRRAEMMTKLQAIGAASRKMVLQAADFPDPDQMLKEAEEDFQKFPPPGFVRDKNYGKD
jgi:hypothetical protein